jgi:hypothetical protein
MDGELRYRGNVPRQRRFPRRNPEVTGDGGTVAIPVSVPAPLCFTHSEVTLEPGASFPIALWIAPESGTLHGCAVHLSGVRGVGALSVVSSLMDAPLPVDTGTTELPDVPLARYQTVDLSLRNDSEEAIFVKLAAVTAMYSQ